MLVFILNNSLYSLQLCIKFQNMYFLFYYLLEGRLVLLVFPRAYLNIRIKRVLAGVLCIEQ